MLHVGEKSTTLVINDKDKYFSMKIDGENAGCYGGYLPKTSTDTIFFSTADMNRSASVVATTIAAF